VNCRRFACTSGFHLRGSDLRRHSLFLGNKLRVSRMLDEL